jgi:hypothetical protein
MTEKLTMKYLSDELQQLRTQMQGLEARLQHNLESKLESALAAAKSMTQPQPASRAVALTSIDAEQRQRLITMEAYLIAERRGFVECDPAQDWAEAERLVDDRLMQSSEPMHLAPQTPKAGKKITGTAKKPDSRKKAAVKTATTTKP